MLREDLLNWCDVSRYKSKVKWYLIFTKIKFHESFWFAYYINFFIDKFKDTDDELFTFIPMYI